MSTAIQLPVKATLIYNFGKFDYCYKPMDAKGENMLKLVIAQSTKPESKRQNFSKPDILKAMTIAKQGKINIEFIITEVNQPEVPTKPEVGKPIQFNKAMPVHVDADLGFLG